VLVLNIEETNIKMFMTKLFKGSMFNDFEMKEAKIDAMVKAEIDGRLGRDYIEQSERRFVRWEDIKDIVFDFIKGRKTPKSMKIIFQFPENRLAEIDENIASASINVIFENNSLICTTGISQRNFSMDKKGEHIWEERTKNFFSNNGF
jgi:hypothetical protein